MISNKSPVFIFPVILFLMLVSSTSAYSYNITNLTGEAHEFWGQFCAPCFHERIYNNETRSCPGNERGCKGETWVYIELTPKETSRRNAVVSCYATAEIPVSAHGEVVFFSDHIDVLDDQGNIKNVSDYKYYYNGDFGVLTTTDKCGGSI